MRSSCFGLRSHHLLYLGDRDKKTTIYIDFNLPSFFLNFTHSLDSLSKSISILVICLPWLKIPGVLKRKPPMYYIFLVESSYLANTLPLNVPEWKTSDLWKYTTSVKTIPQHFVEAKYMELFYLKTTTLYT